MPSIHRKTSLGQHGRHIDTDIAKAADFARPILQQLRERVQAACPAAIEWRAEGKLRT